MSFEGGVTMSRIIAVAICLLACLIPSAVTAQQRVALVIGNSTYRHAPALRNPASDATAVAELFRRAGFDRVDEQRDLGAADLRRAVRDFSDTTRSADVAVIYFAGHGVEVDGTNYIVPVDARLASDFDVEDETLSLDRLVKAIEPARRLRLVILDACRENPFIPKMRRTVASRSIGRGLGRIEPTASDTLIAYAAKAGSVASDGDGANSPFAAALVKHLATPGLDLRIAFGRVRDDVWASTGRRQEPFVYGSLGGDTVALVGGTATISNQSAHTEAERAWAAIKGTTGIAVLEEFARRYGDSFYATLARTRIEELKKSQIAVVAPPVSPPAPPSPVRLEKPVHQNEVDSKNRYAEKCKQTGNYIIKKIGPNDAIKLSQLKQQLQVLAHNCSLGGRDDIYDNVEKRAKKAIAKAGL
jgi:hypothetical protein